MLNNTEIFLTNFWIETSCCRSGELCKTWWNVPSLLEKPRCFSTKTGKNVLLFGHCLLGATVVPVGKGCAISWVVSWPWIQNLRVFWFAFYEETKRSFLQVDGCVTWSTFTLCSSCFQPCAFFECLTEELNHPWGLVHYLAAHCGYQRSKTKQINLYKQTTLFVLQQDKVSIVILVVASQKLFHTCSLKTFVRYKIICF